MGTRSITRFKETKDSKPFAAIYRQFDGYPSGMGADLKEIVGAYRITNGYGCDDSKCAKCGKDTYEHRNLDHELVPKPVANGMTCLAASVIKRLKDGIGNVYMIHPDEKDAWQEYEYDLYADGPAVHIACFSTSSKGNKRNLLWEGLASEFEAEKVEKSI